MYYLGSRTGLVRCVNAELKHLKPGYALTMTINQARSGEYCVLGVIGELSEDIANLQKSSKLPTNT